MVFYQCVDLFDILNDFEKKAPGEFFRLCLDQTGRDNVIYYLLWVRPSYAISIQSLQS